jgi:hypothetical protein
LPHDITNKQQQNIKNSINNSNNTINKNNKWKYININPRVPHVHGTKQKPICPIVHQKDIPGYKLAKYITAQLSIILQLPNTCNIQNSSSLIHNLKNMEIDKNTKLCSFNIENIYTNIPKTDVKNIMKEILDNDNHTPENKKHELTMLFITIKKVLTI